jgi:mono/diheme cytochrome c family protein
MPTWIHKPRRKVLLLGVGASVLVLLGALGAAVLLLSGAYSTAATTQHFKITHRLLDAGLRFSVRAHAQDIEAPELKAPEMLSRGAACFQTHCVQCHGGPGVAPHEEGRGMLPIASNLAQSAREWPPEWLYYVTRKGIRMSGMPAWEFRMSEESLWSTIAFLKQMPFMTHAQFAEVAQATAQVECSTAQDAPLLDSREYAKTVFRQYACHSCHRIEGVVGPQSFAGPALEDWGQRKYVAGSLPNNEENLIRFIRDPQAVRPGSLMPKLDVAPAHAREMARYLIELE